MANLYQKADAAIRGWPEHIIRTLLVIAGVLLIAVGLFAAPVVAGIVLAWVLMP